MLVRKQAPLFRISWVLSSFFGYASIPLPRMGTAPDPTRAPSKSSLQRAFLLAPRGGNLFLALGTFFRTAVRCLGSIRSVTTTPHETFFSRRL